MHVIVVTKPLCEKTSDCRAHSGHTEAKGIKWSRRVLHSLTEASLRYGMGQKAGCVAICVITRIDIVQSVTHYTKIVEY